MPAYFEHTALQELEVFDQVRDHPEFIMMIVKHVSLVSDYVQNELKWHINTTSRV